MKDDNSLATTEKPTGTHSALQRSARSPQRASKCSGFVTRRRRPNGLPASLGLLTAANVLGLLLLKHRISLIWQALRFLVSPPTSASSPYPIF